MVSISMKTKGGGGGGKEGWPVTPLIITGLIACNCCTKF